MIRLAHGFALVTVALVLLVTASVALLLTTDVGMGRHLLNSEKERAELQYITEAGLAHARWQLTQNTSCASYAPLPATNFGGHSYNASFDPSSGSPVRISLTGKHTSGVVHTVTMPESKVYEAPISVPLQLGTDPGKDTIIDNFWDNANWGRTTSVSVYVVGQLTRTLLEFDLSTIPAGVHIVSADLELKQTSIGTPGAIGVHRITRSWEEGTGLGTGNPDGATWLEYDGTSPWAQVGGDFASTLYGAASVSSATNGQWVAWDIRDLVQSWVSGDFPNHGLMLLSDGVVDGATFSSKEGANPANAPKLTINYACECGQACVTSNGSVLLVVSDPATLTTQEDDKLTLIESWDYTVNLIDDDANQADFDAAVEIADVAYVGEDITSGALGTKLREANIGVVIEEEKITDEFGISSGDTTFTEASINVTDNTHYITEPFSLGAVAFASSGQPVGGRAGTPAPSLVVLALRPSSTTSMLDVIETGGALFDTGTAAGRRVKLPWGGNDFDINSLTVDGQTIMKRAIEWGAGAGAAAPASPIAHWKLDETTGFNALDSVGSNHGTLVSVPVWTTGIIDGGLDFDGTDDYVDAGTFDVVGDGLTLMGWFNAETISTSDPRIISKANGAAESDAWWQLSSSNSGSNRYLRMRVKAGGTTTTFADSSVNLLPGDWYFAVGTYDNATGDMKLYLDGSEVASGSHAVGGAIATNPTIPVAIGANGTAERYFDGILDDVRVYNRALSAAEIADLYASGGGGGGGASGVTFHGFTEGRNATGITTGVTIAKPDGVTAGDLLVIAVATDGDTSATLAPPPGWSLNSLGMTGHNGSGAVTFGVWWKIADGTEPAEVTFDWNPDAEQAYGWMMRFTGHDPSSPIATAAVTTGDSTSPLSTNLITGTDGSLILRMAGFDDDDITLDAPGLGSHNVITMDRSNTGVQNTVSGGAGYIIQSTAGDTGTENYALTGKEQYRSITVAIRPAP